MNFLRKWFCRDKRKVPPDAEQSRQVAQRISTLSDTINEQLEVYKRSRDPFAAMMADMYNRDQVARIHRGLKQ